MDAANPPPYVGPPFPKTAHSTSPLIVIRANVLIYGPASQPPITDGVGGTVVTENGRIIYAGPSDSDDLKPLLEKTKHSVGVYNSIVELIVPCVMPGMWDVHSHFLGALPRATPPKELHWQFAFEDRAVKVGRDVPRLAKVLGSGFTSVREVNGLGKHLKQLVDEGSIVGPAIYHANNAIHITGGHCDLPFDVPLSCYGCICKIQDSDGDAVFGPGADGLDECLKAVRRNIRAGASVIKLCCSGGVMTETRGLPTQPQFAPEEIRIMTEEAARHGRVICAHCHSRDGIMAALQNGVKCIEHCTLADEECIKLMLEKDALMVPTRWVIEDLVGPKGPDGPQPTGISDLSWAKLKMIHKASNEAHRKAIQAGVKVAVGCDIFVAEGYGTSGLELRHLVNLGMTPAQAIEAATSNGPLSLGPHQAPKSGKLESGYDADIICLDGNPLENVDILADEKRVRVVIKGGMVQKNTL